MYEVIYSKKSEKNILQLPKKHQKHILLVIERLRIRPQKYFQRLIGEKVYQLRADEYHIIADIQNDRLLILIIDVGHRKNIYK